jgi:hypothetical protein
MEVVEDPLRRGRYELGPVNIGGQAPVGVMERGRVVVDPGEERADSAPGTAGQRETCGQRPGALLEAFDAQQFGAEGSFRLGAPAAGEEAEEWVQGTSSVCGTYATRVLKPASGVRNGIMSELLSLTPARPRLR